ncbi:MULTISPECIES: SRPBCC family protein [unclassified Rhodococcus (in: high G+C Gram-positive bacteria)]|uniref:SRPBCC family protein n=1 Tax=unclassified Rhodococcus (in: high G+C Gram-positive bacteria) TaxID=192944 RepID=UPI00117B4C57|nr:MULTISPECIES: SRPBCC family protein [unclassified Rhodococcus (in: high G+C Gram-positive bacteria)]
MQTWPNPHTVDPAICAFVDGSSNVTKQISCKAVPMAFTIRLTTSIAANPADVFDLESDAIVHAESQGAYGESVRVDSKRSALRLGDEIHIRSRHLGVWFTLTSRITEYEPARYFVDEQVTGPFASMRHEHFFLARRGHTQMVDIMSVEFRGGRLGAAILDIPGKLYLRRVLCVRNAYIKKCAEAKR